MRQMDLRRLDLNLLVVLKSLLETGSVSQTAEDLGMSQATVSRSLGKLREVLDDKLLVKGGRGMLLTARAEVIGQALGEVLGAIETFFERPDFDPAASERVFRIGASDYGALAILPRLSRRLSELAPGIRLDVEPPSPEIIRALAEGRIDLLVSGRDPVLAPLVLAPLMADDLFEDDHVCLVRRTHPILGLIKDDTRPSLDAFLAWPHVAFLSPDGRRCMVDAALAELGLRRRIAVSLPYPSLCPLVVRSSDLIVTLPGRVGRMFAALAGLVVLEPPIRLARLRYRLVRHERAQADPAVSWLRATIATIDWTEEDAPISGMGFGHALPSGVRSVN